MVNRTRIKKASRVAKNEKRKAIKPGLEKKLRIISALLVVLSAAGLFFATDGSAMRRVLTFALPITKVVPEPQINLNQAPLEILRVEVDENVGDEIRIEVLTPTLPKATSLGGDEPRILIYHTHTTEAYTKTDEYTYEESAEWRTKDNEKNIVAVGALLAKTLREEYGCSVIHDTTDHEPPKLSTSYSRSEVTMKEYMKKYPSIVLMIDVHRDAGKTPMYTIINGKRVARMMFVVGTGEGATGTGFKEMPDFETNYALALDITNRLAKVDENLMRNIRVKVGRYNQHVAPTSLLVEMGDNANTLEEALNAVPYLAYAIVESTKGIEQSDSKVGTSPLWAPNG